MRAFSWLGWSECEHALLIDRPHSSRWRAIYYRRHYLAVVQRKAGARPAAIPTLRWRVDLNQWCDVKIVHVEPQAEQTIVRLA